LTNKNVRNNSYIAVGVIDLNSSSSAVFFYNAADNSYAYRSTSSNELVKLDLKYDLVIAQKAESAIKNSVRKE
jgi:hypothetical protein